MKHGPEVSLEEIAPQVRFAKLSQGRIYYLSISTAKRESVDAFFDHYRQLFAQHPANQPFYALNDFRHAAFTPYTSQATMTFMRSIPKNSYGLSASILADNPIGQMMRRLAEQVARREVRHFQFGYFNDYAQALAWLEKDLKRVAETSVLGENRVE